MRGSLAERAVNLGVLTPQLTAMQQIITFDRLSGSRFLVGIELLLCRGVMIRLGLVATSLMNRLNR